MDPKSPGADAAWARLTAEPDQQTSLIEKIDASLGRVDDGTYGIDERTGEPIEPARLGASRSAAPTSRRLLSNSR